MIKFNEGYYFETSKRIYHLYEGVSIGAGTEYTSDILFIMDDDDPERPAKIAGFIYGASLLDSENGRKEISDAIADIVAEYEKNI